MVTFDTSSGQIFTETTIQSRRKRRPTGLNWYYVSRGRRLQPLQGQSSPPSLESLALRTLLNNLAFVEDGALDTLPLLLAQKYWDSVEINDLDSLHAWKLFAAVCEFGHLDVKSLYVPISLLHEYHGSFSHSMAKLSSPTCAWVTIINLSHLDDTFTQADVMDLGRLPNLIALQLAGLPFISPHSIDLDDRLAMHLGRLADERCFPRLRTLFIDGAVDLTEKCFFHLNKLPALTLLSLRDARRTEPRLSTKGITAWGTVTEEELERIVVTQEDSMFPLVSEERFVAYRQGTPLWIRYASSIANQIGPKPRIDLTLVGSGQSRRGARNVVERVVKRFLKTKNPDVLKNGLKRSSTGLNTIQKQPTPIAKGRQVRGSKLRKIEDAFF